MARHNGHRGQREYSAQQGGGYTTETTGSTSELGSGTPGTGTASGEAIRNFASGAAETAREQAQAGAAALGSGLRNLAGAVRQNAPQQGMMGMAATNIADTLERGGTYIQNEGIEGLVNDVGTLVRNNPLPAICISVGVGFLVASFCRSVR